MSRLRALTYCCTPPWWICIARRDSRCHSACSSAQRSIQSPAAAPPHPRHSAALWGHGNNNKVGLFLEDRPLAKSFCSMIAFLLFDIYIASRTLLDRSPYLKLRAMILFVLNKVPAVHLPKHTFWHTKWWWDYSDLSPYPSFPSLSRPEPEHINVCYSIYFSIWLFCFNTTVVWHDHGVSVDHLSDQLYCVVQELCSLDVSPGAGLGLFELRQEVAGP